MKAHEFEKKYGYSAEAVRRATQNWAPASNFKRDIGTSFASGEESKRLPQ